MTTERYIVKSNRIPLVNGVAVDVIDTTTGRRVYRFDIKQWDEAKAYAAKLNEESK